jgi:hypothetical protein
MTQVEHLVVRGRLLASQKRYSEKSVVRHKHSSLLGRNASGEEKKALIC